MTKNRREFLKSASHSATALFAAGTLHQSISKALAVPADRRTGTIQDVEHVIVLMQENRSFDHYFGTLRGVRGFGDPHPVPLSGGRRIWDQRDQDGQAILPFRLDTTRTAALKVEDLPHAWSDATAAAANGKWDGWILAKGPLTMGHYQHEDIQFQFALAEAFTICDAYHCSIFGSTTPNRIFHWAGSNDPRGLGGGPVIGNSSGMTPGLKMQITPELIAMAKKYHVDPEKIVNMPSGPRYHYTTYPERLEAARVSWKVYQDPDDNFDGLTNPAVAFKTYVDAKPGEPLHDKAMAKWTLDDLRADVTTGRLPQVSWIVCPQSGSEHPGGSSPIEGANFTARVLDALTANPDVWSKSVLFLNFDESDGFFDHVPSPLPPGFNPDGSRAGDSTVDTLDDIHTDKHAYGLGVRVPMIVVSPWSAGGWVNSEVFDHTSVIRFLEIRFGVKEPNISAWRRAVAGDLSSAFDFSKSNNRSVKLPNTADAKARVAAALTLPPPTPPSASALPVQESGMRPSRALPYAPTLEELQSTPGAGVSLRFENQGRAGVVYRVDDLLNLDAIPRHYTVESGKTLDGRWEPSDEYHLEVRGPNQWYRELRGPSESRLAVRFTSSNDRVAVSLVIQQEETLRVRCRDLLGAVKDREILVSQSGTEWTVPTSMTGGWYDISIKDESGRFSRRFSGRLENGRDSISRPSSRPV